MAGYAEKQVGNRKYRVYGLDARAQEIRSACRKLADSTTGHLEAARTALADWKGPHADAFVERVNPALGGLVALRFAGELAAAKCSSFPAEGSFNHFGSEHAHSSTRISGSDSGGSVSADPGDLKTYAKSAADQSAAATGVATAVTTEGLRAEMLELRALNSAERDRYRDKGVPEFEINEVRTWSDPVPVPVTEVFGLPDLSGQAATAGSTVTALGAWVAAVAYAVEAADSSLADLLLKHPELAGFLDQDALTKGRMSGDAALLIVLANLALFDLAAGKGNPDKVVSLEDLQAIAGDTKLPEHLQEAAQYLLDNRLLLSQASIIDSTKSYEVFPEAARLTPEGIALFLEYNAALRAVGTNFDKLDVAAKGGKPDDYVSVDDLEAAAANMSLPAELRKAAEFLLANGMLSQRLALYQNANLDRSNANAMGQTSLTTDQSGFWRNGVIALAIDQQAFGSDPSAARRFVLDLPLADRDGNGGLPFTLVSDEGLKALANAALLDAGNDLSDQHKVIAHLPETSSWLVNIGPVQQTGGVRNMLITGFYDLLAKQADELFAGENAGHPAASGHPGANWLMFAPWASYSIGGVINGQTKFELLGGLVKASDPGASQGAAHGNQWIFNDIGGRFSAFLEMYENNPRPSDAEIERFFRNSFGEGDGTIRTGFAAYIAALEEDDPVRKQQLLFSGNTLVATHEQAGVQPYLEDMFPDYIPREWLTSNLPPVIVAGARLKVQDDLEERTSVNNAIIPSDLFSLDPAGRGPGSYPGDTTRFQVGSGPSAGVVDLDPLAGIESFRPDFSPSTSVWFEQGGGDPSNPESLTGTGASDWTDWEERMHNILKMFEQYHTDPALFDTSTHPIGLDQIGWLEDASRPRR